MKLFKCLSIHVPCGVTSIVAKFADFQKYDRLFVLQVCHLRQAFKPTAESCIFVHIILQECKM